MDQPNLRWAEVADPVAGTGEVIVDVEATALNRADLLQRSGRYPVPEGASEILGLEMAGRISELGDGVTEWAVGDSVCALLSGGGYAERVRVPAAMLMPVPSGWSMQEAGAMPETFYTAYVNLVLEAGLHSGETVLIHGGASGVGTSAIQLAVAQGFTVYATAGTDEKCRTCEQLGATRAFNYKTTDFAEALRGQTGGVDVILDPVGADYLGRNVDLLNVRGRLVLIGLLSGARAELDLSKLLLRRLRVIGSVLRSRSLAEKIDIRDRFMAEIFPLMDAGRLRPVIDSSYPIQHAHDAHERMRHNLNIGKIGLSI
ncbi:MAG: NAD(P)H-quinone oxidoreductase [Bacteroidota bacterium]